MRNLLMRGAFVAFFALTGVVGSGVAVDLDGVQPTVQMNDASAKYRHFGQCHFINGGIICTEA